MCRPRRPSAASICRGPPNGNQETANATAGFGIDRAEDSDGERIQVAVDVDKLQSSEQVSGNFPPRPIFERSAARNDCSRRQRSLTVRHAKDSFQSARAHHAAKDRPFKLCNRAVATPTSAVQRTADVHGNAGRRMNVGLMAHTVSRPVDGERLLTLHCGSWGPHSAVDCTQFSASLASPEPVALSRAFATAAAGRTLNISSVPAPRSTQSSLSASHTGCQPSPRRSCSSGFGR